MSEPCNQAQEFLNAIFVGAHLDLRATIKEAAGECLLNIDGEDVSLLMSEGGELLEALQHLASQAYGRMLPKGERIVCDVRNFRAVREAELRVMAQHAAERVRTTGLAFTFAPMDPNERRVIHLALAGDADLHTESIGEGASRRLKVSLKSPAK